MTVEVCPIGAQCHHVCVYCYQNRQQTTTDLVQEYDIQKIKKTIEVEGRPFTLSGCEPLLISKHDLEELWSWGFFCWGHNSLQTNGVLIDEDHIRMFQHYNVTVGISIDGPDELNNARGTGQLLTTRLSTAKTQANILRLCDENISLSLIVTLHRLNATGSRLDCLQQWLRELDEVGVKLVRLNLLEVDKEITQEDLTLSVEENVNALISLAQFEKTLSNLRFELFDDIKKQLLGRDNSRACICNACDPLTSRAVREIEDFDQHRSYMRKNKKGIEYVKAESVGFERYMSLYNTPQEYNGCSGCRFFLMCKGNCPGTAIDGDWRNRTSHCPIWLQIFKYFEEELLNAGQVPLSQQPQKRCKVESIIYEGWSRGENIYVHQVLGRTV
ncbi:MAG: radical SAM protein [Bacteroidales bacterium]|nr:radical SAM protein [Bacteroidales bacterium]